MEKQILKDEQIILNKNYDQQKEEHEGSNYQSEHLEDYLRMMNYKDIQQCKNHKSQLIASLSNNSPSFHADVDPSLKISVIESSRDCEYALLEVRYNRFEFCIWLLNVDEESPSHKIAKSHCGNFSTVYHTKHNGKDIAVKCTAFRNKTFQKVFRDTLLEYLVFEMAARLRCGPAMPKLFAFDLLIFKNCIEFSMEFCSHRLPPGSALTADLTAALRNLHSINVIHFDIKPENICFSQQRRRAVFIDFGLHAVVREEVGQKSVTKFSGSLLICSEEMRKIFMEGTGEADLYYNDALCLRESLKEINNKTNDINYQETTVLQLRQTQILFLINLKYLLLESSSLADCSSSLQQSYFIDLVKKLGNSSFQSLMNFIDSLAYSISLEKIILKLQRSFPEINGQYLISARLRKKIDINADNEEYAQNEFVMRLTFIKKLNNPKIDDEQPQSIQKEHISLLTDEGRVRKLPQRTYYRLFSQVQQVNCWKVGEEAKEAMTLCFNKIWLRMQAFDALSFKGKQGRCFRYICEFVGRQIVVDKPLFLIIKYSLLSAILLQIYTADELKAFITAIMTMQSPPTTKMRMFVHSMSCLQWLHQCIIIYNYYYFKDIIYSFILEYLSQITQEQKTTILQVIDMFVIFLSQGSLKNKLLREKLVKLEQKIFNKYFKYYTAIRQQEQLLAQVYVYTLHALMQFSENNFSISFDLFNKLLALQSYRKQAKLCIYDYYEHSISLILMRDQSYISVFKELKVNNFLGKQYIYNHIYSTQMQNGKNFYINGDTIYFYDKNLSKMSQQQALYYRVGIFDTCNQLVLKAPQYNLVFDLPSLASALSLSEIQHFLPQLRALARHGSYHSHFDTPHHFGHMYKMVLCYWQLYQSGIQDILDIDIVYKLADELVQFIDELRCVNCKFRCLQVYFMNKGPKHTTINLQQLQQYLLQFILWRMKQSQLYKKETAEMIGDLCCLSNHKKAYEILLVQYVMYNNILPTIFYDFRLQLKKSYHKRLLNILWDTRFMLDEDGQSLYFCFIFYLCRHFEQNKFRNQQNLSYLCKLIELFLVEIDYQDFMSVNSQFLYDNKHKLLQNQKYSALYFSVILNHPHSQLMQIARPFYYIFICNLCNNLNTPCKTMTRGSFYFSFVRNQVKYRHIKERRYFFLLKLEYKYTKVQKYNDLVRLLQKKAQIVRKASAKDQAKRIYDQTKKKMEDYFFILKKIS